DVVGVWKHRGGEAGKGEAEARGRPPDERHARLHMTAALRRLLQAQAPQDRDDLGDQRLADQELRATAVVEERDLGSEAGQKDRERGSRRPGPEDGHAHHAPSSDTETGRRHSLPPGLLAVASTTVNCRGTLYGDSAC